MQGAAKGSQLQVLLTVLFWLVGGGLTPTMETDTEGSMQAEPEEKRESQKHLEWEETHRKQVSARSFAYNVAPA